MNGLWKADLLAMPTRVIAKTRDFGGSLWVQLRLDEGFGLQFFMGPVRRRFHARYNEVFDRVGQIVMAGIANYGPMEIRIIAGDSRT